MRTRPATAPPPASDPWLVDERDYPAHGTRDERLRFLARYALLAPSGHNAQPWLFRLRDGALELLADRTRALPVVDPEDRELVIGCGAALFCLRVAAAHFGHEPRVELLPPDGGPDLLARIGLGAARAPTAEEERLFASLPRRHTSRAPFGLCPVPDELLGELAAAAARAGVWLHVFDERGRARAAELVAAGDRIQGADARFRRELAAWLHPNRTRSRDGIPMQAFGLGGLAAEVAPLLVRRFDWGDGRAARDQELAQGSPALALLGTDGDAPADWLRAGQALAHVLLAATAEGLAASFLNQAIEVPELRPRLAALTGRSGHPQLLLRLGFGAPGPATPRRALEEVWCA